MKTIHMNFSNEISPGSFLRPSFARSPAISHFPLDAALRWPEDLRAKHVRVGATLRELRPVVVHGRRKFLQDLEQPHVRLPAQRAHLLAGS